MIITHRRWRARGASASARLIILCLLTVSVLLTVAFGWWITPPVPSSAASSSGPQPSDTIAHGPSPADFADAPREAVSASLRIVDGTNAAPIENATLRPLPSTLGQTIPIGTLEANAVHHSDSNGCIAISHLQEHPQWLVSARGRVSCIVERPHRPVTVQLSPSASLMVTVTDESESPLEGALVVLQPNRTFVFSASMLAKQLPGTGDPRSPTPIWAARTDGLGKVHFDDLPAGDYRMLVVHHSSIPGSREAVGEIPITAPGSVLVRMEDLYAACVAAPPGRSIKKFSWIIPAELRDRLALQICKQCALDYLSTRFPDAIAYVGRPANRNAVPSVGVRAMLDGKGLGEASVPLTRIADIEDPAWMTVHDDRPHRSVVVHVLDRSGNRLPLALRLVEQGSPRNYPVVHPASAGESVLLPSGRYAVMPDGIPPWVREDFKDTSIEIDDNSPPTIEKTITLSRAFRQLVVRPRVPPEFDSFLHFSFQHTESGQSWGRMNWAVAKGPVEVLVPPGEVTVTVQAARHRAEPLVLKIVEGSTPHQVDIDILPRSGNTEEPARPSRR